MVTTRIAGLPFSPPPQRNYAPVHLDVGGTPLTSTLSTLTSVPGSKIHDFFTGRRPTVLDIKSNSYFIDRDGELFRYVLQFLRESGSLYLPEGFQDWEALKKEADYWELNEMRRIIKKIQNDRKEDRV